MKGKYEYDIVMDNITTIIYHNIFYIIEAITIFGGILIFKATYLKK